MAQAFGFLNTFKPPGISSAGLGSWIKRRANGAAVGHWGTLDPTACGVLVFAVGAASRLLPLLTDARKAYVFELVAGERTDSADASGTVLERTEVGAGWSRELSAVAASLVGSLEQLPPMHSAVKVAGQPLYRAARAGLHVQRRPRTVRIYELQLIAVQNNAARLFVRCDAGTYVRVLCEEIGRRLTIPARMGALLRVAAGPFLLHDSLALGTIGSDVNGSLIDPLTVLSNDRYELDAGQARRFAHGISVSIAAQSSPAVAIRRLKDGPSVALVMHDGKLIGFGQCSVHDGTTTIAPTRVFAQNTAPQGSTGAEANE